MSEVELPELPESEREERKDATNTLIAVTVIFLVAFMAMCKITDNNIVLNMQRTESARVDHWGWYQAVNVREDINQSKMIDLKIDMAMETAPALRKASEDKLNAYEAISAKLHAKREEVKTQAERDELKYEKLDSIHEKFDRTEAFISLAVSMLALTSLLQKRWLYGVALLPALTGIVYGISGMME